MSLKEPSLLTLKQRRRKDFELIYKKYYKLVYFISLTLVKDEHVAQDIMQDTFVSFMNHIEDYQENGKVKQYLTTISKNLSLNYLTRKNKKHEILDEETILNSSSNDHTNNKIEVMLTLEKTLLMEEVKIVSLKVLYDYSFKEIAEEMNQSIGMIQAKYYKAIEKLKVHFQN